MRESIEWFGQAGQDRIANFLFPSGGTYVEIGGGQPFNLSNSAALEALGWQGVSIEQDADLCREWFGKRSNRIIEADATKVDWADALRGLDHIDFMSADIDELTLPALLRYPFDTHPPGLITYEHNRYLYADTFVTPARTMFRDLGYELICADVRLLDRQLGDYVFEDWFVRREIAERAAPLRSDDIDWKAICRQAGIALPAEPVL
jgi:hypothetical protein